MAGQTLKNDYRPELSQQCGVRESHWKGFSSIVSLHPKRERHLEVILLDKIVPLFPPDKFSHVGKCSRGNRQDTGTGEIKI